jgi:hypothetical protein
MRRDNSLFNFVIGVLAIIAIVFSGALDKFIPSQLPAYSNYNSEDLEEDRGPPNNLLGEENSELDGASEGMFTKLFAKALVKALKTPGGRKFLTQILDAGKGNLNLQTADSFEYENFSLIKQHFKVSTFEEGEGIPAQCGDKVKIRYKITNKNTDIPLFMIDIAKNKESDNFSSKSSEISQDYETISTYLGEGKLSIQAENIITGMKPGALRYGELREKTGKIDPPENAPKFWVELLEVTPSGEVDRSRVEMFDDVLSSEMPLICGDKARFNMSLQKFDGANIIDANAKNNLFEIKIGSPEYPYDLTNFIYGKFINGRRVVITPGKNLEGLNKFPGLRDLSLSPEEFYMLKIYNAEVTE